MKSWRKWISVLVVGALAVGFAACGSKEAEETPVEPGVEALFTPGTYEGEADGFHGKVKTIVTVSETAITDIRVEHTETAGLGDTAIDAIVALVMGNTSLNIPVVSGATYSSNAVMEAITLALEKADADIDALKANPVAGNEVELGDVEKTADVVVIGGGGAGLAAAVSAHQNGAKVIVLEKMPRVGGNTIISGSAYNAADMERQKALTMTDREKETVEGLIAAEQADPEVQAWQEALKAEWEAYLASGETGLFDSPSLHKLQTYNGGDRTGDVKLISVLAENALGALEWLESLGMGFTDHVFTVLGGLWSRAHKPEKPLGTGYIESYMEYIAAHSDDIEILLETEAEAFIMDNGVVTGVMAKGKGGAVTVNAKRGVVLATGGFGANVEMRDKYNTSWPSLSKALTTNHPGATGDGIVMAEAIHARLIGLENLQLLPMGDPVTGSLSGNIEQGVQDRIFVNKEGSRFVDEGARRDVMTKALMEQTDATMWVIVDKHSYPTGDTVNNFNESIDGLVEAGRAFKADTLEELAALIGVDVESFVQAVEDFNAAVEGTVADAFGRTLFDNPIDTAPFYAGARVPTVHHTMGGVAITEDAQVVDANGDIIPGLYAAGEITGGIHGTNRLGGNALADIAVFGRIAGESAALRK